MTIRIEILKDNQAELYEQFLISNSQTLFFYSNKYRLLLRDFLQAEDFYFIATNENNEIVGALPTFIKRNEKYGNVLNSLPFYGSHGSIIEFSGDKAVRNALLNACNEFAKQQSCVATTLITSPFENDFNFYEQHTNYTYKDHRIGQITTLPDCLATVSEDLMNLFHQKTRNMVRKAAKSDLEVVVDCSLASINFLADTHTENMNKIGGMPKPKEFFQLVAQYFKPEKDYKIFTALKEGKPIASLLVFYFNKTVEYFTPVIIEEYRTLQPMSLLIFEAMQDAVKYGYSWWNWGGTWTSQDGVYHFKSRWGTTDYPYYYYIQVADDRLANCHKSELVNNYPWFYVVPFEKLKQ